MNPLMKVLPTDRLPHGWQVVAMLLATGSIFTLCWWLSQMGLLDLAATGASFYVVTLARQVTPQLSRRAPREFEGTAKLVDQARADFAEWMSNRKLLSHALIAVVVTISFLTGRAICSTVMQMIASPWLALALGLALAAMVASPVLVKAVGRAMTARAGNKEERQ